MKRVASDVHRTYYPNADVRRSAEGIAGIAAQSSELLAKYPTVRIDVYVWPAKPDFYITRASARYVDGKLAEPMYTFTNDVLK